MTSGIIFDVRRFSIHDGPGIRTTIFMKGCPLDCWWCHNPESQARSPEIMLRANRCIACGSCVGACPEEAIVDNGHGVTTDLALCVRCGSCTLICPAEARELVGKEMTVAGLIAELERDRPFYDETAGGVTISGGEPLMQPAFLLELLRACKAVDLHTVLDTSGYASWKTIEAVCGLVDLFLYDIKLLDAEKHREYTGVSNDLILGNLARLSAGGAQIILRVPVIPGVNADEEEFHRIGKLARSLSGVRGVDLLPYHAAGSGKYQRLERGYRLEQIQVPGNAEMGRWVEILREYVPTVKIGG